MVPATPDRPGGNVQRCRTLDPRREGCGGPDIMGDGWIAAVRPQDGRNPVKTLSAQSAWSGIIGLVLASGWLAGAAHAQSDPSTLPRTLTAVHCDPQNADPTHWLALVQIVQAAEARHIKLSIHFTPQWIDMIEADANKLDTLATWRAAGHEIGGHHHTIDHDAAWDGYSNDPNAPHSTRSPGFLGDMAAYADQLQRIAPPGGRVVVVSAKDRDMPPTIPYQTGGNDNPTTDDALSRPTMKVFYGRVVWNIKHAPLARGGGPNYEPDIEAVYQTAGPDDVIGVAFHPMNWLSDRQPVLDWFDFLASQDPAGVRSKTAYEILSGMVIPGDADLDQDVDLADLARVLVAYGTCSGNGAYDAGADIDADGCVGLGDVSTLLENFGLALAGP